MAYKDTGAQVEFINVMGEEPTVIARGSYEETLEALQEGREINQRTSHPAGEGVSPGAIHSMGRLTTGLGEEAQASLEEHCAQIQRGLKAQKEKLGFAVSE